MLLKKLGLTAMTLAVLAAASSVRAGIIQNTLVTNITNSADTYAWANVGSDGNGTVSLTAPVESVASYNVQGVLDGDPSLTIIQNITNTTGVAWDSYTVNITPAVGYTVSNIFVNAPISQPNYLPTVFGWGTVPTAVGSGTQIIYTGGLVPAGATFQMYFTFDITETSGTFGYGIQNTPHLVPEPASMAILGLGTLMLLKRKR